MRLGPLLGALFVSFAAASAAGAQQESVRYITTNPNAPFSQVVQVGNTIYLSGMLGTVPGSGLVAGGIQPETRQTLENIRAALAKVGATMDDVVKCTVFLADMAEWGKMNEVYVTFFPKNRPARSAVGVNGLASNARVEIECMAVSGPRAAS